MLLIVNSLFAPFTAQGECQQADLDSTEKLFSFLQDFSADSIGRIMLTFMHLSSLPGKLTPTDCKSHGEDMWCLELVYGNDVIEAFFVSRSIDAWKCYFQCHDTLNVIAVTTILNS